MRGALVLVAAIGLGILAANCGRDSNEQLLLGTTTSIQDPGLLDELVAAFENEYDYDVKPIEFERLLEKMAALLGRPPEA